MKLNYLRKLLAVVVTLGLLAGLGVIAYADDDEALARAADAAARAAELMPRINVTGEGNPEDLPERYNTVTVWHSESVEFGEWEQGGWNQAQIYTEGLVPGEVYIIEIILTLGGIVNDNGIRVRYNQGGQEQPGGPYGDSESGSEFPDVNGNFTDADFVAWGIPSRLDNGLRVPDADFTNHAVVFEFVEGPYNEYIGVYGLFGSERYISTYVRISTADGVGIAHGGHIETYVPNPIIGATVTPLDPPEEDEEEEDSECEGSACEGDADTGTDDADADSGSGSGSDNTPAATDNDGGGMPVGAVIGIVVAVAMAVLVIIIVSAKKKK